MKTILLSVILSLFFSSCGIFKNRSVNTETNKQSTDEKSTTVYDSTKNITIAEKKNIVSTEDYEAEIIITTDTGNITITGNGTFTGKARNVTIKSKGSKQVDDKSVTNTTISERKYKLMEVTKKTYYYGKIKNTESEFPWAWAIFSAIAAIAVYFTIRKLVQYHR